MFEYNPYAIGRWYKFFVESDGTDITLTESDVTSATISDTGSLMMPSDEYKIGDVKVFLAGDKDFSSSADNSFGYTIYIDKDTGKQKIKLPTASTFTDATIYAFINIE